VEGRKKEQKNKRTKEQKNNKINLTPLIALILRQKDENLQLYMA